MGVGTFNYPLLPPWAGYTYQPTVPKLYWNVKSQEQRIKMLCCELVGLEEYSDKQTEAINKLILEFDELTATYDDLYSEYEKLEQRMQDLEDAMATLVKSLVVYDPTKGIYTNSMNQSRRMMQVLSTPKKAMRSVEAVGTMKVSDAAAYMCGEFVNESFAHYLNETIPYQEVDG